MTAFLICLSVLHYYVFTKSGHSESEMCNQAPNPQTNQPKMQNFDFALLCTERKVLK